MIESKQNCPDNIGKYIYMIFNTLMSIVAIYLANCNGLHISNLLVAIIFPYFYIIYSIIKYNGICIYKKDN